MFSVLLGNSSQHQKPVVGSDAAAAASGQQTGGTGQLTGESCRPQAVGCTPQVAGCTLQAAGGRQPQVKMAAAAVPVGIATTATVAVAAANSRRSGSSYCNCNCCLCSRPTKQLSCAQPISRQPDRGVHEAWPRSNSLLSADQSPWQCHFSNSGRHP